jgi:putative membrane-bound dehydrogenase-like protein
MNQRTLPKSLLVAGLLFLASSVAAAGAAAAAAPAAPGERDPARAVAALDVHEGLQATLFASEPMLLSPTNLDIDQRGRVWVCEVVNYRGHNGKRPEGDRILILEDADGDGRADVSKVFHQGRDIDSAMGICVLGTRIIVSCSPNIFVFHDEDGDDKPERKEALFTKTGQPQHDHSAHSFVFGPDGKHYWNFGNSGEGVHDRDGKRVIDLAGNEVIDNGRPYYGGMVFRSDADGGKLEVLGHNFRNNYEVAVDSFGTLWQSDNDDDGNRGVRINYVMEFGNYGYRDEKTGAGWSSPRTGMDEEIPRRHWHLSDPGVVPNLLQTGAGSPCGITVYEGRLLPAAFHDQPLHCEAGHNVVRAYPTAKDGAGYSASVVNLLHGARDSWFRPADVCVAPDGSVFVTDWYDPGVGGHAMRDLERGRIFRVAPPGHEYRVPRHDYSTAEGAAAALRSPSAAVRYLAWTALRDLGPKAEPALERTFASDPSPRQRARALWALGKMPGAGARSVEKAAADRDPDLRIVSVRLARQLGLDLDPLLERLARDESPQVRRECALALRHRASKDAARLWAELAGRHDGKDRWYLEALGIGADRQWDAFLDAWLERAGEEWRAPPGRDLIWRSRAAKTPRYLAEIITDPRTAAEELPRYLRAFDFLEGPEKTAALLGIAFGARSREGTKETLAAVEAAQRLRSADLGDDPRRREALEKLLDATRGTSRFVSLVDRFDVESRHPELLALAAGDPDGQLAGEAMRALLAKNGSNVIRSALDGSDAEAGVRVARALGAAADGRGAGLLLAVVEDAARPAELRRQAARSLARTRSGALELVRLAKAGELDESLKFGASLDLSRARWDDVREAAAELFPLPPAKDARPLPPIEELVKMRGDTARGKELYRTAGTCANCHVAAGEGREVGPDLSEIGAKLDRESLFESILYPSAGISHSFEAHAITLETGDVLSVIITSETPEAITARDAEAVVRTIPKRDIVARKQQTVSLMPADLHKALSAEDLADLVEYLATLRKGS